MYLSLLCYIGTSRTSAWQGAEDWDSGNRKTNYHGGTQKQNRWARCAKIQRDMQRRYHHRSQWYSTKRKTTRAAEWKEHRNRGEEPEDWATDEGIADENSESAEARQYGAVEQEQGDRQAAQSHDGIAWPREDPQ